MIKRVVAYGCSHAYGTEMSGRHDSTGSREFVWGNLVAKHYDVPFHRVAQPGNSNEGILHNVIEHCQEGDLAVFSNTQLRRAVYTPIKDGDVIEPENITKFDVGMILDEHTMTPKWLDLDKIKNRRVTEFKQAGFNNTLNKYKNTPHLKSIAEYYVGYKWNFLPMFITYLSYYASWNAIAKSRGAYQINFMFDEASDILHKMFNLDNVGPHFKNSFTDKEYIKERMPHTVNTSKHYKDWLNDETRICKGELSLMKWVLKQQGLPLDEFPDNRFAHVGKEQQPLIASEIIKRCEKLGYE